MAGIEDLIAALGSRLGGTLNGASPFGAGSRLGGLSPFGGGALGATSPFGGNALNGGTSPFRSGLTATSPFAGQVLGAASPFGGTFNVSSPFGGTLTAQSPFTPGAALSGNIFNPYAPKPSSTSGQSTAGTAGTPSSGLEPNVAQWASQAQSTFADLGGDMPDVMLAIMTNESGGDPNAYNAAGDAYGLFQQLHLGSNDPNVQFQAAHQLAQEKLNGIATAYAKNGLNPDQRQRALDFALAWAGHFDYSTGRANPGSRDIGSGQSAADLSAVFLKNYDAIKNGRAQAAGGQVKVSSAGFTFPVVGFQGPVQLHWGSEDGGADLMAPVGSSIVALGNGVVTDTSPNNLGGNTVTMRLDNGLIVYMAHMRDAPLVRVGQRVAAGTPLGFVGTTGNAAGGPSHLHIGIGSSIISGDGPTGGLGSNFDAVTWLNQILQQTR